MKFSRHAFLAFTLTLSQTLVSQKFPLFYVVEAYWRHGSAGGMAVQTHINRLVEREQVHNAGKGMRERAAHEARSVALGTQSRRT